MHGVENKYEAQDSSNCGEIKAEPYLTRQDEGNQFIPINPM